MINKYIAELTGVINELPCDSIVAAAAILEEARNKNSRVYLVGNGGGAAIASHLACDFGIFGTRLRAAALNDGAPTLSAFANDHGYEKVFSEQLDWLADCGDVLIGISASGASCNVLEAVAAARRKGMRTIGMTGATGGALRETTDVCVMVPCTSVKQIEDALQIVGHILVDVLVEKEAV